MRVLLTAVLLLPTVSLAQSYRFNDKLQRDTVNFVLNAPFERINGLSNALAGEVVVEKGSVSGSFRVPVKSLRTGIALRDEHLLGERWLHAEKHPEIVFSFKDLKLPAAMEPGKPVQLSAEGEFTVRGVKRTEKVQVTATLFKESEQTRFRAEGDLLHLTAEVKLPIESYGIQRTQALLLKVGDVANVTVDAWGSTRFPVPVAQTGHP